MFPANGGMELADSSSAARWADGLACHDILSSTMTLGRQLNELLVLSLLRRGPVHGCQVSVEVEERSGGLFTPGHGTLDPILRRLETEGLIAGEGSDPVAGRARKSYAMTEEGRTRLEESVRESRTLKRILGSDAVIRHLARLHARSWMGWSEATGARAPGDPLLGRYGGGATTAGHRGRHRYDDVRRGAARKHDPGARVAANLSRRRGTRVAPVSA
jgi:PadR family transcriptional regulator, regulatory protein PadR